MTATTLPVEGVSQGKSQHEAREKRVVKKQRRERIVIDANSDAVALLDELKERTGSGTRAELLRNMMRFTAAYLDEIDSGSKPLWIDASGQRYTANSIPRMLLLNWQP